MESHRLRKMRRYPDEAMTERTTRDTHAHGTREALIRSAVRVGARKGLRGLTYRAVAEDAGLAHGMIVHHFGSRDALIAAALEHTVRRTLRDATAEPNQTSEEIGSHLGDVTADEDVLLFQREMINEARRRPELQSPVRRILREYESAVQRQLAAVGVTDSAMVVLVAAAMEGLVQRELIAEDRAAVDGAMRSLRRIIDVHREEGAQESH